MYYFNLFGLFTVGYGVFEMKLRVNDRLVALKRDVSADHVVEEDAKRPDGGRYGVVAVRQDPLGRTIYTRT